MRILLFIMLALLATSALLLTTRLLYIHAAPTLATWCQAHPGTASLLGSLGLLLLWQSLRRRRRTGKIR